MNKHQNQCASLLFQLMQHQSVQVDTYLDYLDEIKQAITLGDSEQLNQLLTKNKIDINCIQKTQRQQAELLDQYGYQASDNGLQNCIKDCQQPDLNQLNLSLTQQFKQLEKSLLINELLIQKNQDRIRQSIRILSGHGVSLSPGTYSRQGNKDNNVESKHSIALA